MDFSPEDVGQHEFLLSVPGYNRAEVRAFLQAVATQLRQMNEETSDRWSVHEGGSVRAELEDLDEMEVREDEKEAGVIDELLRAAEIRIEDAGTRLVAQVESVREEIAHLLRSLDRRVGELTAALESAAQSRFETTDEETPNQEAPNEDAPIEVVSAEVIPPPPEPETEPEFEVEPTQEVQQLEPDPHPVEPLPTAIQLEEPEEEKEIPPEWSELFVEPRMDPSS